MYGSVKRTHLLNVFFFKTEMSRRFSNFRFVGWQQNTGKKHLEFNFQLHFPL